MGLRGGEGRPQWRWSPAVTAAGDDSLWVARTLANSRPASSVATRQAISFKLKLTKKSIIRTTNRKSNLSEKISLYATQANTSRSNVANDQQKIHTVGLARASGILAQAGNTSWRYELVNKHIARNLQTNWKYYPTICKPSGTIQYDLKYQMHEMLYLLTNKNSIKNVTSEFIVNLEPKLGITKLLIWSTVKHGTIYVCTRFLSLLIRKSTNRPIHNSNINLFTCGVVNLRSQTKPHSKTTMDIPDEEYDPERPFQGRPDLIYSSVVANPYEASYTNLASTSVGTNPVNSNDWIKRLPLNDYKSKLAQVPFSGNPATRDKEIHDF